VSLVELDAVHVEHEPDLAEDSLAGGLDAEHLLDLLDVVGEAAGVIYLWDAHNLLQVGTLCLQDELLLGVFDDPALFVFNEDLLLVHVDLLDALDALDDEVLAHHNIVHLLLKHFISLLQILEIFLHLLPAGLCILDASVVLEVWRDGRHLLLVVDSADADDLVVVVVVAGDDLQLVLAEEFLEFGDHLGQVDALGDARVVLDLVLLILGRHIALEFHAQDPG